MKRFLSLIATLFLAVTFSGCTAINPTNDVYTQQVNWQLCEDQVFQCAKVKVPLDWGKPDGQTIELAVIRKFTNNAVGSLLINPGGPGGSGYDFLANNWADIGTAGLRSAYTLVSFDPRGVSRSAPVKCFDSKGTDHLLYDANDAEPGSAEDIKLMRAELKTFVSACEKNTGKVLGEIDTVSAAKDMDVIRAVLGDSKLNYLGFSYGTFLGTTYASLFPDKVGRFVLDGAIDPRVTDEQQSLNQLAGFDLALNNYLKDCVSHDSDCPFKGNLWSAKQQVKQFLKKMESSTLPTDSGRKLTIASATTGLIMALYSLTKETRWRLTLPSTVWIPDHLRMQARWLPRTRSSSRFPQFSVATGRTVPSPANNGLIRLPRNLRAMQLKVLQRFSSSVPLATQLHHTNRRLPLPMMSLPTASCSPSKARVTRLMVAPTYVSAML
jgi:pimeloyl-ACP methyl ester carboxylesterase